MNSEHDLTLESLLIEYQKGDDQSFHLFFLNSRKIVYAFLQKKLSKQEDIEDVFQNVYFRIHKYILTYDPARPAIGWVLGITKNALIDFLRSQQKIAQTFESRHLPDTASPNFTDDSFNFREFLNELSSELSNQEFQLLFQRVLQEDSFEEIAMQLNISQNNARQKLSRLLRRLRTRLANS